MDLQGSLFGPILGRKKKIAITQKQKPQNTSFYYSACIFVIKKNPENFIPVALREMKLLTIQYLPFFRSCGPKNAPNSAKTIENQLLSKFLCLFYQEKEFMKMC